jgi:hypothetical protein
MPRIDIKQWPEPVDAAKGTLLDAALNRLRSLRVHRP